jgi:hypothetical protein
LYSNHAALYILLTNKIIQHHYTTPPIFDNTTEEAPTGIINLPTNYNPAKKSHELLISQKEGHHRPLISPREILPAFPANLKSSHGNETSRNTTSIECLHKSVRFYTAAVPSSHTGTRTPTPHQTEKTQRKNSTPAPESVEPSSLCPKPCPCFPANALANKQRNPHHRHRPPCSAPSLIKFWLCSSKKEEEGNCSKEEEEEEALLYCCRHIHFAAVL